jgi:hypothetical protein
MLRKYADDLSNQVVVIGEECILRPVPPDRSVPLPPGVPRPPRPSGEDVVPQPGPPLGVFQDIRSNTWQDQYGCWYGVTVLVNGEVQTFSKTLIPCSQV